MESLITVAGQYGALGMTVLASFWYINKKDGEHKIEREETRDTFKIMHEEALEVTRSNTNVLLEISTIIKNKL